MTSETETVADLVERLREVGDSQQHIDTNFARATLATGTIRQAASTLTSLEAERVRLREALAFYRDEWTVPAIWPRGEPEPNMRLCNDQGDRARAALTPEPKP